MRDTFAVMRMTKLSFNLLPKGVSSASKQSQEMATNEEANREGRLFTPQPNNPVPRCQKFWKGGAFMTDLKDFEPIQINTLYGFDNVKNSYWLVGYDVVNMKTGHIKKLSYHKRNYPYVTLETNDNTLNKKCLLHHILALAYIHNGKFEVIEHLDDNPLNYDITNLKFSTQSENLKRAFKNGHGNRIDKTFKVTLKNGESYEGTLKELSALLNIPRQTLYCRYYKQSSGRKIQSVKLITDSDDSRSTD